MKTKILRPTEHNFAVATNELKRGGLIGLPTETVYGLAADAFNSEAVAQVFVVKNRPQDNPLIVHIHEGYDLFNLVTEINDTAKKLMKAFMPGPLTLVLKSKGTVSPLVSRGLDTVAIRMPSHKTAIALLKASNLPLAAPSANISTRMSATTAKAVKDELGGKIKYIIDGKTSEIGIESTVVDATGDVPIILRPGKITSEQIKKVCGSVQEVQKIAEGQKVASPGMKYKHYSPSCPVVLVDDIKKQYYNAKNEGYNPVVLGLKINLIGFIGKSINMGETIEDYAKNLYSSLRKAEKKYNYILIYAVKNEGLGKAIMNRVNKMVK
ncbi:MAG: L-threonylcarbamoyladenylate synthase [Spirochaetales bacterium]